MEETIELQPIRPRSFILGNLYLVYLIAISPVKLFFSVLFLPLTSVGVVMTLLSVASALLALRRHRIGLHGLYFYFGFNALCALVLLLTSVFSFLWGLFVIPAMALLFTYFYHRRHQFN